MSLPKRTLEILSCNIARQGTSKAGNPYTVYSVEARDPQTGALVNQALASFDPLPIGVAEYLLKEFRKDDGTVEYTLYDPAKPPRGGGGGGGAKIAELESRVSALESKIHYLVQRQQDSEIGQTSGGFPPAPPLTGQTGNTGGHQFPPAVPQQQPQQSFVTTPSSDDDIPF